MTRGEKVSYALAVALLLLVLLPALGEARIIRGTGLKPLHAIVPALPPELPEVVEAPAPQPEPQESVWDILADCESNGEWDYGPHSGWGSGLFQGGLQWKPSTWTTWRDGDDPVSAIHASREQEIAAAERLRAAEVAAGRGGYGPWPACAEKLGLPR